MQNTQATSDNASHLPAGQPLHELEIAVRWGDMDALGHVNNIMYFRYFELIRLDWFEKLGNAPLASAGAQTGAVIVDNHAEYLQPIVYPAKMFLRMAGHSPGRSSFVSTYTITVGGELYTRGSARVVWTDANTNKSTPLPQNVLNLLGAGQGSQP